MLIDEFVRSINSAIKNDEFVIYLQPQYKLSTMELVGAEALVRWNHPQRGFLTPQQFIPQLEYHSLTGYLDQYMFQKTCELLHKWMLQKIKLIPISINISSLSLRNTATIDYWVKLIKNYDLSIGLFDIELTETTICEDINQMNKWINHLKHQGFRVFMDDFGSGYSSLNRLRELSIDVIKLDRGFLTNIETDKKGKHIITSIVELSQKLDMLILAEGIEKGVQLEFLKEINCNQGQGFLFSPPLDIKRFEEEILKRNIM